MPARRNVYDRMYARASSRGAAVMNTTDVPRRWRSDWQQAMRYAPRLVKMDETDGIAYPATFRQKY